MEKTKSQLTVRSGIAVFIIVIVIGLVIIASLKKTQKNKNTYVEDYPSIAVLPFVNLTNDQQQDYFSDGLSEGIINSLAHLKGLKVCAWSSSLQFKKKVINIREVGRQLGVASVLEGSAQLKGDRIIITASLVNVKDSVNFWSAKYDESMDDIFALQAKIMNAIAEKLEITLMSNKQQTVAKKPTTSIEAYELYLKGRSFWNLRTPTDLKKGIDFFQQAISIDTSYAAAYSGIADCYTALGYGSFLTPKDAFPRALEAAAKAIKLDSTLAEPHASLGYYNFYYEWDWAAAEQEFRIAIALNPNYELGYDWYGYYLTAMTRYDEARIILKKAKQLDPLSVPITTDIGFSVYYSGNYDLAVKELQSSLQMNPNFGLTHLWLGRSYQAKKIYPDAIAEYKKALNVAVNWPVALAAIGSVYGESGDKANAQKILDTLNSLLSKKFVTSYGVALVYAGLGETEQAFAWLNKAYEERSNWLVWLKSDPRWAPLKSDKRFKELVNKVGLPQ